MDLDCQIKLSHLLFKDRKCKICGKIKNLTDDFYRTRKDRGPVVSSYSYECKKCSIKRVIESRKKNILTISWEYPDW